MDDERRVDRSVIPREPRERKVRTKLDELFTFVLRTTKFHRRVPVMLRRKRVEHTTCNFKWPIRVALPR